MQITDINEIKKSDAHYKSEQQNELACKLAALYEDSATTLTLNYLRSLGLGNPDNRQHPLEVSILKRIIDGASVVYNSPATRSLWLNGEELRDSDPLMVATDKAWTRSGYDLIWQRIDSHRNLFRTCVVEWAEDHSNRCVGSILYGPHQVFRTPDALEPHNIARDSEVLLCLRLASDAADSLYRLWRRDGEAWHSWIVDGDGEACGAQPYGESGETPFGALPLQIVYDEASMFRAWLPMPGSRVSWPLAINASVNDLAYLTQQQAHAILVFKSDSTAVPTEVGPGTVVKAPTDGGLDALDLAPKIADSQAVIDQQLRLFAISEYLPGNIFESSYAQVHTGQALRVANHPLAQKRWRQLQLMPTQENQAWQIYASVHNANAQAWRVDALPDQAEIGVTAGMSWQPSDVREAQDVGFKNLAAGMQSRIMLAQELFGFSRPQAIEHLERVASDDEMFPAADWQNAAAMVSDSGPMPAFGADGAAKNPDAFNPDIASSNEQASVVGALQRAPYEPK